MKAEGSYDEAIGTFEQISGYQDSAEQVLACHYLKAEGLAKKAAYEVAYAEYILADAYTDARERAAGMAYQAGLKMLAMSDHPAAIGWFEKALTLPEARAQLLGIGEYYYTTQQYDQAEAVFAKVAEEEDAARRLYELGQYYELLGSTERAAAAYRDAGNYADAPEKAKAMTYMTAETLMKTGDYETAKTSLAAIRGYRDADAKIEECEKQIAAAAVAAAVAAREAKLKPYKTVGNYVTFGHYPQTRDGNDNTAIEWLVLDYDAANNRALLLSRYGLDAQPYNKDWDDISWWDDITWEKCTLRTWLNGTFLNKAFTTQEQSGILLTNVDNSKSQNYSRWGTNDENNTQDKVFLLSYAEANKYLGVTWDNRNNTKSRVAPTAYGVKQGVDTSSYYKTADGEAAGWWWLRSPAGDHNVAAVRIDGALDHYSDNAYGGVRPALWINLKSDIF